MASFNKVILMGNLTRDPELKELPSGQSVCKISLATNRQFKNRQNGNLVQEVCYIDVDIWGPQAETSAQYLKKGSSVLVEGRLKYDTWQDNDGTKRSKHSIVSERITFLPGTQQVGVDDVLKAVDKFEELEQNHNKKDGNEIDFKDDAPFDDNDLPF